MFVSTTNTTPSLKQAPKAITKSKSKAGKNGEIELDLPKPSPELMDIFTRQTAIEQNIQLIEEHQAKLSAQRQLHEGRLAALREQMQIQLFTIWNEVWLQREKAHNDAFKAWLKVLLS